MKPAILVLAALTAFCASSALAECGPGMADVGGYHLWTDVEGTGRPVVVFEAGGGDTSLAWKDIIPQIQAMGVQTVVYDRAGLGRSEFNPGAYSIDEEARAFQSALTFCGVEGPVIVVAHSYGGFVAELAASQDKRIHGLVLVDANIPNYFNDSIVAAILGQYRPRYDALRTQAPDLAKVLIPMMEAYPATVRRMQQVALPSDLPVIDIVAETSWQDATPWRKAHADFDAAAGGREGVFAESSGHQVMRDRPDVVVGAVRRMIAKIGG